MYIIYIYIYIYVIFVRIIQSLYDCFKSYRSWLVSSPKVPQSYSHRVRGTFRSCPPPEKCTKEMANGHKITCHNSPGGKEVKKGVVGKSTRKTRD